MPVYDLKSLEVSDLRLIGTLQPGPVYGTVAFAIGINAALANISVTIGKAEDIIKSLFVAFEENICHDFTCSSGEVSLTFSGSIVSGDRFGDVVYFEAKKSFDGEIVVGIACLSCDSDDER